MSNDNEETDPELLVIIKNTHAVMRILEEAGGPDTAMSILAAAASCVLCMGMHSSEDAREGYNLFKRAIELSVKRANSTGMTAWREDVSH